jgi:RimJ/RimL family protein N-acetyltransferase
MKLETARLILRPPKTEDAESYLNIHNSEFAMKYNAMTPKTLETVRKQFSDPDDSDMLIIELRETGAVVGSVCVEEDSIRWGVASKELSYFLGEQYSRKGYMKEALGAVIDYLFETENLLCVSARSFAPNTASRKLLESLGFTQNGYIPACVKGYGDVIFDDTLYSLFRK